MAGVVGFDIDRAFRRSGTFRHATQWKQKLHGVAFMVQPAVYLLKDGQREVAVAAVAFSVLASTLSGLLCGFGVVVYVTVIFVLGILLMLWPVTSGVGYEMELRSW